MAQLVTLEQLQTYYSYEDALKLYYLILENNYNEWVLNQAKGK